MACRTLQDLYDLVLACFSFPPGLPLGYSLHATLVFFKYPISGSCLPQCPYGSFSLCLEYFPLSPYKAVCLIVVVRILLTYIYCLSPPLEHASHEARNIFLSIVVFPGHRIVTSIQMPQNFFSLDSGEHLSLFQKKINELFQ